MICILALTLLCIAGAMLIPSDKRNPYIETVDGSMVLLIPLKEEELRLKPWQDEQSGVYYFFLPSFVTDNRVITGVWNKPIINWKENEIYDIEIQNEDISKTYSVSFLKASIIPSMYIHTESGSMSAVHSDKEYEEAGKLRVISSNGSVEYIGDLERISGRGNTSWEYDKKPYSIKLTEPQKLCGLQKGKKWNLLPIWREGNKMNTKVLFDIAATAGLEYTPECTWVDLYLNDEYVGIYLLSESISVSGGRVEISDLEDENELINRDLEQSEVFEDETAKGYELSNNPEDITGGYLIEKDLEAYYEKEKTGFITDSGITFTISAPQHASREQVYYIKDYIQNIENLLQTKGQNVEKYMDIKSFAAKYLVDEISLNFDANITSMYFYKERNNDLLYAGPVWDYDSALGECNAGYAEGWYVDYNNSILDKGSEFDWYSELYGYEIFREEVKEKYEILLPYLSEVINHTIDMYAESIRDSVAMDNIRWKNEETDKPGNYTSFDSNVRYLKYFLTARLEVLNQKFEVSGYKFRWNGNRERHQVLFMRDENVVQELFIEDGATLEELPPVDDTQYWGWYFIHNDEKYRKQLPILEDTVLYAKEK